MIVLYADPTPRWGNALSAASVPPGQGAAFGIRGLSGNQVSRRPLNQALIFLGMEATDGEEAEIFQIAGKDVKSEMHRYKRARRRAARAARAAR